MDTATAPVAATDALCPTGGPAVEDRFRAMGSDCHLIVCGPDAALLAAAARRRIEQLEGCWSRFLPTSELSRLNAAAGGWVPVGLDTRRLLLHAIEAWRLTAGRFDPTILPALRRAGYTASFEPGAMPIGTAADMPDGTEWGGPVRPVSLIGPGAIELAGDAVRLPVGMALDAGGIGKGLAADLVCEETMAAGARSVCVNLGGDLRVAGPGPGGAGDAGAGAGAAGTGWTVAVEHELRAAPLCLLGLAGGAVATSTTLRRRWRGADGALRHHLIDPFTGAPSTSDLELVSVVGGAAWLAEVLAKAVLLRGSATAFDILPPGVQALAVDRRGVVRTSPGLQAFLGPDAGPLADLDLDQE